MKSCFTQFHRPAVASLGWLTAMALAVPLTVSADESPSPAPAVPTAPGAKTGTITTLDEAIKQLKLPGVKINLKEHCVDVASSICLEQGTLELIACTKDTKEHESIVIIEALPKHVHTALLLLGAQPGNPAMRKALDENATRWVDMPPRGAAVEVFLLIPDKAGKMVERPISDFIVAVNRDNDPGTNQPGNQAKKGRFPTHTFVFAGSILDGEGTGPRKYLSDLSGNVISIATFGDEVLCLPEVHTGANDQLMWQLDRTDLPALGTKITLRLRPQLVKPSLKDNVKSTGPGTISGD